MSTTALDVDPRECAPPSEQGVLDLAAQAQTIKANVVCYLIKPFAADDLLACVRCALRRHDVAGE